MKKNYKLYWKLFTSTFYLSAFTFGGGLVIVPLMTKKFAHDLKWIEEDEVLNLAAIAQASPGAIAVNASILIGYRVAGFAGAFISILGTILPPLILTSIISIFYETFSDNAIVNAVLKGMRAGVAAVIADVVIGMGAKVVKTKDIISIIMMPVVFAAVYFLGVNLALVILVCGVIGLARVLIKGKSAKGKNGEVKA